MESVSLFEAKTQLSALVERAGKGETIVITKHGKPTARLVPMCEAISKESLQEVVAGFRRLRKRSASLSAEEIKAFINEGRK